MNQTLAVASGGGAAPDLGDLGFPSQTQGNAQDQARPNGHMLQMHQRMV